MAESKIRVKHIPGQEKLMVLLVLTSGTAPQSMSLQYTGFPKYRSVVRYSVPNTMGGFSYSQSLMCEPYVIFLATIAAPRRLSATPYIVFALTAAFCASTRIILDQAKLIAFLGV